MRDRHISAQDLVCEWCSEDERGVKGKIEITCCKVVVGVVEGEATLPAMPYACYAVSPSKGHHHLSPPARVIVSSWLSAPFQATVLCCALAMQFRIQAML